MNILVATASRHGSTTEIGDRIADLLRARGMDVAHEPMGDVNMIDADAVVLGCAIYMGQWIGEGRSFLQSFESDLKARPCWVFSSGPTGDPLKPEDEPDAHGAVVKRIGARDGRVFPGALDMDELGFAEKMVVKLVHVEEGDYRPWDEIDAFAESIASTLADSDAD